VNDSPTEDDVKQYWERYPLLSHELGSVSAATHWQSLEFLKLSDIERFAIHYWKFDDVRGKKLLDIGCGPGWLTVRYAAVGAEVFAVDLTESAVNITRQILDEKSLSADLRVASAESLPFEDESFDIVVSSGVLHHTPDTLKAFREAFRVTRPGGAGLITLYRLGILHSSLMFPLVQVLMRMTRTRHPGADLAKTATSVQDFVRQYDGFDNPVGIAKTNHDWCVDLEGVGWTIEGIESHYFPLRMVPVLRRAPRWLHKFLDKYLGTMVYFTLRRSSSSTSSNE
jgi:SAM-dependent methyltransferase